jgi:hypothetical protein
MGCSDLSLVRAPSAPAPNPDADIDTTPLRSVNYMVNHICEPISPKSARILSLNSPGARWGQKIAYALSMGRSDSQEPRRAFQCRQSIGTLPNGRFAPDAASVATKARARGGCSTGLSRSRWILPRKIYASVTMTRTMRDESPPPAKDEDDHPSHRWSRLERRAWLHMANYMAAKAFVDDENDKLA